MACSPFGGPDHYIAISDAGSPLLEEHLELLTGFAPDRMADAEQAHTLFEIAKLVDCVQDGAPRFVGPERAPGFLSDRYLRVVDSLEFAPAPVDAAIAERYEQALTLLYEDPPFLKTAAYEEFCILRTDIEQKEISLVELRRRRSEAGDQAETDLLDSEISALEHLIAEQRDVLQSLDRQHSFTLAEETKDAVEKRAADLPKSVQDALGVFDLFRITDAVSNETHVMCDFFPSHTAEDNWIRVKISKQEIESVDEGSPFLQENPPNIGSIEDDKIESIEVEVQALSVQRPWFWEGLFENRLWRWRSPQEPVSEGGENGRGMIPSYVSGLVLARNLIVRGRAGATLSELPSIKFGNILMKVLAQPPAPADPAALRLTPGVARAANISLRANVATPHGVRRAPPAEPVAAVAVPMVMRGPVVGRAAPGARPPARRMSELYRFDNRLRLRMPLSRVSAIRGTVKDENGRSILGATVELRKAAGGGGQKHLTGRDGGFIFKVVAKGDYVLKVTRSAFTASVQRISVRGNMTVPVVLRRAAATAPVLQVTLYEGSGATRRPFEGQAEITVKGVGNAVRQTERVDGPSKVSIRLGRGRYQVTVTAPAARGVEPRQRTVNLSRNTAVEFQVDSGVLLRNPDMYLVGFVCRRVPKSPDPDPSVFP